MKYKSMLPGLTIFAVFLFTGIWSGQRIGNMLESIQRQNKTSPGEARNILQKGGQPNLHSFAPQSQLTDAMATELKEVLPARTQRNILVIGVNHLGSPSPELEGVWLVLYLPDMPRITLMPIFPSVVRGQNGGQITADFALTQKFLLGPKSIPDPAFFEALNKLDIHWDNYLLLDEIALIDLIDFMGGLEKSPGMNGAQSEKTTGVQTLAQLQPTIKNPEYALLSQMQIAQRLCRATLSLNTPPERIPELFDTLGKHLVTDLQPSQVIADLKSMLPAGGSITCEFPFLALLSSIQ